jgi:hypothetical protein
MSGPRVSGRLVRSFLRYLKEREGEAAFAATARELPAAARALCGAPVAGSEWVPLETWQAVLAAFEARFGDPATLQLLREMTRATMAVAVQKGWSAFMADITPDLLLQRSNDFWNMSYDTGALTILTRGPRRCRLALDGWRDPPPEVVASLAEACVVFLVRLGERGGRAVEERSGDRAEIDLTW